METLKVFVENLQKPRKWWQEYAFYACFFAGIAALASACATYLSREATNLVRQDIVASHRPYVYVTSRVDSGGRMDVDSVLIRCLNAPAEITDQRFSYEVSEVKTDGEETVTRTIPWASSASGTVYPSERTSIQVYCRYDLKELLAKDKKAKLKQKARIDYKELSSDRTYYFEAIWHYDRQHQVWVTDHMFGT